MTNPPSDYGLPLSREENRLLNVKRFRNIFAFEERDALIADEIRELEKEVEWLNQDKKKTLPTISAKEREVDLLEYMKPIQKEADHALKKLKRSLLIASILFWAGFLLLVSGILSDVYTGSLIGLVVWISYAILCYVFLCKTVKRHRVGIPQFVEEERQRDLIVPREKYKYRIHHPRLKLFLHLVGTSLLAAFLILLCYDIDTFPAMVVIYHVVFWLYMTVILPFTTNVSITREEIYEALSGPECHRDTLIKANRDASLLQEMNSRRIKTRLDECNERITQLKLESQSIATKLSVLKEGIPQQFLSKDGLPKLAACFYRGKADYLDEAIEYCTPKPEKKNPLLSTVTAMKASMLYDYDKKKKKEQKRLQDAKNVATRLDWIARLS